MRVWTTSSLRIRKVDFHVEQEHPAEYLFFSGGLEGATASYFSAVHADPVRALAHLALPPTPDPLPLSTTSATSFLLHYVVGVIAWLGHRPTGYVHPVPRRLPAHPGHPLRIRWFAHRFFQGDFVRYRRGVTCHAEVQHSLLYQDTLWSMEDDRCDNKRANPCGPTSAVPGVRRSIRYGRLTLTRRRG